MSVRLSSGFRNALCAASCLVDLMDGGVIYLYGGAMPETPDNPPGTTLLAHVTTDGAAFTPGYDIIPAGLRISWIHPGAIIMNGNWMITGVANGTVTWFRWCWRAEDTEEESQYFPRLDGSINDVLRMSNPIMTSSRTTSVENFILQLPMGA